MDELPGKKNTVAYFGKVSDFKFSKVDIIIPFHGQYVEVRRLLESLFLHTKTNPYLVTLVDDASPNRYFGENLSKQIPVRVIRQEQQKGFAAALNRGFAETINPYIVVLHSDCQIKNQQWLQLLGESMLGLLEKRVYLLHAQTNEPTIEHPLLKPTLSHKKTDDNIVTTDDPLPLVCAMFPRELFVKIGGFLKEYPYAGYENVELFYRMKNFNLKQAISGKVWVEHDGGSTINEVIAHNKSVKSIMEQNYDLCLQDLS